MIFFDNANYIHCPKTGGSSFEQMCESRHGIHIFGDQHNTARDIPAKRRGKWTFGFIRDPMLAEYSNFRYHKFSWGGNEKFDFDGWCEWRYTDKPQEYGYEMGLNSEQVEYGYRFNIRPQSGYFCDESGRCIADDIFRYEEIVESLVLIGKRLGIDCNIEGFQGMAYHWGQGREKYKESITERSIEIVKGVKGVDFMLHSLPGKVRTDAFVQTVPKYAYSR